MGKILNYIKDRFVNGEKSTYIGIGLVLLYLLGHLSSVQVTLIADIAGSFGYEIPGVADLLAGVALVAAPTKKK